jgi:hypothetical protein
VQCFNATTTELNGVQLQKTKCNSGSCSVGLERNAGGGSRFVCGHLWQRRESFAARVGEKAGNLQILHGISATQGHGIPSMFKMRMLAKREVFRKGITENRRLSAWKVGGK